jgi:peptidoglycan hydrolase-like protein with peptidoglycan-binding domain
MPPFESNQKEYILNLQRYLRQLSATEPDITPPPLDGIFDTATENSLRQYQALRGLPVTGRADLETWTLLYEDYLESLEKQATAEGLFLFPDFPDDYAVYPEEEHFLVMVIQFILNELRIAYDEIPQNSQSGVYDLATRQGILAFQRRNRLNESDRVDRATWNALAREYRRLYSIPEQ